MRPRAKRWASEDAAYRALRAWLLPGQCEVCVLLESAGVETTYGSKPHYGGTLHHRRKRSSSGALADRANVLVACAEGNATVERYPERARSVGTQLVVREGDPEWDALSSRAWRLAHA